MMSQIAKSFVLLLFLTGCVALGGKPMPPEEVVAERAQQRWDALVSGELDKSYALHTPAFRAGKSLERYKKSVYGVGVWKKAVVDKVKCDQALCKVAVNVTTSLMMGRLREPIVSTGLVEESWLYDSEAESWWFVP